MDEIFQLADRVTVLRDGAQVGTRRVAETSSAELVQMMVGRQIDSLFPKVAAAVGAPVLEVRDLVRRPMTKSISLTVRAGEIVGLAGLVGSGRTETLKAVFGVLPIASGTLRIDGKPVRFRSPADAIAAGIAFVPEDRQAESIFQNYSIMQNICVAAASSNRDPTLKSAGGVLNRRRMAAVAERLRGQLQIKASSIRAPIASLSGGNQQKTILARWMAIKPSIVLADEPTRGVSIGSKIEIYRLIRQLAAEGTAVVIASSEFEELVGLCSRVFIIRDGRTEDEIDVGGLTAEDLLHLVLAKAS